MKNKDNMRSRTLITLTTIPSRIPRIPITLKSLCLQTEPVDKIRVYIPNQYERFTKSCERTYRPILYNILDLDPRIEIIDVIDDLGPLSKIAFAVIDPSVKNDFDRVIFVDDDGPGIPERELENVFKPFYKIDKSRGESKSSVGLGLSITSDAIKSHGGNIILEKSPLNGLRVKIFLPL